MRLNEFVEGLFSSNNDGYEMNGENGVCGYFPSESKDLAKRLNQHPPIGAKLATDPPSRQLLIVFEALEAFKVENTDGVTVADVQRAMKNR